MAEQENNLPEIVANTSPPGGTPASQAAGIFVCYRRNDSAGYSEFLVRDLKKEFGKAVFFDVESVAGGRKIGDEVRQGILTAAVFLLVIGDRWVDARDAKGNLRLDNPGDWVVFEIGVALKRLREEAGRTKHLTVLPVILPGAVMPVAGQLPEAIREVAEIAGFVMRGGDAWDEDVEKLVARLKELRKQYLKAQRRPIPHLRAWLGGLATAVLLAVTAYLGRGWNQQPVVSTAPASPPPSPGPASSLPPAPAPPSAPPSAASGEPVATDTTRARGLLLHLRERIDDVSVDFLRPYSFVVVHATGGTHKDPTFAQNWEFLGRSGRVRGAYHVFNERQPVEQQVAAYLEMVQLADTDLQPILDAEIGMFESGVPNANVAQGIRQWVETVRARTHRIPVIYTYNLGWDKYMPESFGGYPLFAGYAVDIDSLPTGWQMWNFRQFAKAVKYDGREVGAESIFEGNAQELASFIRRTRLGSR